MKSRGFDGACGIGEKKGHWYLALWRVTQRLLGSKESSDSNRERWSQLETPGSDGL